ncbi:MAG: hypothetical protein KME27_20425 [Lyngbya sp. HA4199-MV5]|nr:hypothetical protein [Lyngbya sp. HA4199-MV5]
MDQVVSTGYAFSILRSSPTQRRAIRKRVGRRSRAVRELHHQAFVAVSLSDRYSITCENPAHHTAFT